MAVLLLLSVLVLFGMFSFAESAPQEAVYVGLACYLGICARIAQAGRQSRSLEAKLQEINDVFTARTSTHSEARPSTHGQP